MVTPQPGMVLLVEEDPGVRAQLADCLRNDGYQVTEARNGLTAILLADQHRPPADPLDVVLLDMELSELSGGEVLHHFRTWEASVPVVAMSAQRDHLMQALAAGARTVLAKPCAAERVRTAVGQQCGPSKPGGTAVAASPARDTRLERRDDADRVGAAVQAAIDKAVASDEPVLVCVTGGFEQQAFIATDRRVLIIKHTSGSKLTATTFPYEQVRAIDVQPTEPLAAIRVLAAGVQRPRGRAHRLAPPDGPLDPATAQALPNVLPIRPEQVDRLQVIAGNVQELLVAAQCAPRSYSRRTPRSPAEQTRRKSSAGGDPRRGAPTR